MFWLVCEEEKDEAEDVENGFEGFSEVWVECKVLRAYNAYEQFDTPLYDYEYDSLLVVEVEWNDLSAFFHRYDENNTSSVFNEWGQVLGREVIGDYQQLFEYQDKWKETKQTVISESYGYEGDTSMVAISTWDGLFRTTHQYIYDDFGDTIRHVTLNKALYNEYGRILENYNFSDYSEPPLDSNKHVYIYEDGWRLILEEQYGNGGIPLTTEYQWEDNKKIYIEDISEGDTRKYYDVETYNYYWKLIKRETFVHYLNDNNEWELETRIATYYEYECPGFEQIYP